MTLPSFRNSKPSTGLSSPTRYQTPISWSALLTGLSGATGTAAAWGAAPPADFPPADEPSSLFPQPLTNPARTALVRSDDVSVRTILSPKFDFPKSLRGGHPLWKFAFARKLNGGTGLASSWLGGGAARF